MSELAIDVLLDRLKQVWGHTDLRDKQASEGEYEYKYELSQRAQELLGLEVLRQLIDADDWSEICGRVVRSFQHRYPLPRWDEYQWVGELDPQEQQRFALALVDFLYGEELFLERLERFVAEATAVYGVFRDREPRHKKNYKRASLAWTFVSYFHFMIWPDREYPFIKPSYLREAAEAAGYDLRYRSTPNPETYTSAQEFYRALWPTVQGLGGSDWIDIQTFIYVVGGGYGVPEGGWIDERSPAEEHDNGWRAKLREWLRGNSRTMPDELRQLRQEFVERFPTTGLGELTLEQYALGHEDSGDSFCYWLEYGTEFLGSVKGGSVLKFGVWWDKETGTWKWNKGSFRDPEDALSEIKSGLQQLVEAVEAGRFEALDEIGARTLGPSRYSLRAKPLNLYFPEEFLPISNPNHMRHFLRAFGEAPEGDLHALNRQLLQYLRNLNEFDGFDTLQMMQFLYYAFPLRETSSPPVETEELQPPPLSTVLDHIANSAYIFSEKTITNYHLSLLTKPFVILTGLSGTGKTKLTRLYADAVHGIEEGEHNPYYAIVAVRPDWTDSRGLLGYFNPLTRSYEATPFLRFMLRAAANQRKWHYLCLDEMNLARVEYYFSDFLSAMESKEPIVLHGQARSAATLPGDDVMPTLPITEEESGEYVVDGVLYVPPILRIPPNLALSGTVNVDETTHAFSDKVLDRANSIEFNQTDLDRFARRYRKRFPDRATLVDEAMPLLSSLHALLEPRYLHFGYRTLEEVLAYVWQNEDLPDNLRRPRAEVLDNQLIQKVLPKLRGDERIQEMLEELRGMLEDKLGDESRSVSKLNWMIEELEAFGSTHFWR